MDKFDRDPECPKCGSIRISSKYQIKFRWINVLLFFVYRWELTSGKEFIERKCQNCGYSWDELPLDDKGKIK